MKVITTLMSLILLPFILQANTETPQWSNVSKVPNFFIQQSSSVKSKVFKIQDLSMQPVDCRQHIEEVMCLVDPAEDDRLGQKRPCLEGGKVYAKPFQALYDYMPPLMQKMFCSINVLYIEKHMYATAYAGLTRDEYGQTNGAVMGVRKSLLDNPLSLSRWASWKEQLSFGGIKDSYDLTPSLPQIHTQFANNEVNDFLYFVVAHEFGHMFDFSNQLNQTTECKPAENPRQRPVCKMHPSSWGAISWDMDNKPKLENDFQNREGLCFYRCDDNPLPHSAVSGVYRGLADTNFISTYAAIQPWDDFADSLAYYLSYHKLGATYILDTQQGQSYDIMEKMLSSQWQKKFNYIKDFLNRKDIVYP